MGLARVYSAVVVGVRAHLVEVEAHLAPGLPGLTLVGLADTAVNESRDRVRAAVANSGLKWPGTRITVGLSPAGLPKRGPGLDLAVALAVLAADGQVPVDSLGDAVALGELGLDGRIRPVAGALAAALTAADAGKTRVITGRVDARQAELVPDLRVMRASRLIRIVAELRGEAFDPEDDIDSEPGSSVPITGPIAGSGDGPAPNLADVMGQAPGKRALEVAATGGHHLALLGRAGVGKTLLAERLVDLLPDLGGRESLEVTAIHQLGNISGSHLITRPPFQAPHHTSTRVAMVGGGSDSTPTVGVVSLAHRGVLFLDEAAEFEPNVLDALREPMDAGSLTVARAAFRMTYPARFQLVMAANPCPCGNALDTRGPACNCTPAQRRRYLGRLSGPLMDRIDVRAVLTRPTLAELRSPVDARTTSEEVAARVAAARALCRERLGTPAVGSVCEVSARVVEEQWQLPSRVRSALDRACSRDSLRGRGRILRLCWTLADLAGRGAPSTSDVEEAVQLRSGGDHWAVAS